MHVFKTVGLRCLLKRPALMSDPTVRRVRSLMDLASLIPDLAIMVRIDLAMMNFGLDMDINQYARCVRMELFSSMRKECETEQGLCSVERTVERLSYCRLESLSATERLRCEAC